MTHKLSPSQIGLWNTCHYRWGRVYLDGDRETGSLSAQTGETVHKLLEAYLRDGVVPERKDRIGKLAFAMCANLPPKGTVPRVEEEFTFEHDGITYGGRVDARTDDTVYDQKTTSHIGKYAKTKADLAEDVQALVYARWLDRDGQLVWNYGQTKGDEDNPKTRKVALRVVREDVIKKFDEVVAPAAREILAAYDANDVKSLAKNFASCDLYPPYGCPRKRECHVSLSDKLAPRPEVQKPIGTLYVDCIPLQGEVDYAFDLIRVAAETVRKDLDLPHAMLADYGKGGAYIAAQLEDDIRKAGFRYDHLVLFTKTPEGRACQHVLASLAENVIQAA